MTTVNPFVGQTQPPSKVDAALYYATELAWPLLPVHWIEDGRCSCGLPECGSAGKHPFAQCVPHGHKDASADPAQIQEWWQEYPKANVGVRTGPETFLALDIDPRNGAEASLTEMIETHGPLPTTPISDTGGGGHHVLFRCPPDVRCSGASGLGAGLERKASGGFVILPPSTHLSGRLYRWHAGREPWEVALADPPDWVLGPLPDGDACEAPSATMPRGPVDAGPAEPGERNNRLAQSVGSWLRKGTSPDEVQERALDWNRGNSVPLPESEVLQVCASITKTHVRNAGSMPGRPKIVITGTGLDELEQQARVALRLWNRPPRLFRRSGVVIDLVLENDGVSLVREAHFGYERCVVAAQRAKSALHGLARRRWARDRLSRPTSFARHPKMASDSLELFKLG